MSVPVPFPFALTSVLLLASCTSLEAQLPREGAPSTRPTAATLPGDTRAFDELVTKVRAAHRQGAAPRSIDAFRAEIDVRALGNSQNLEISLEVKWKAPELMRYEITQGNTRKQRGIDETGEWESVGNQVLDLQEQRSDAGLLEVQRHLQLCKQIVRLLDPADVLGELRQTAPLRNETVALSAAERAVPCTVVSGLLKSFPLYHQRLGDDVHSVRCELYFATESNNLRAVRVTPLDQTARPRGDGEWVVLLDQKVKRGILLPHTLMVSAVRGPGLEELAQISIKRIDLAPNLAAADFKRPGK